MKLQELGTMEKSTEVQTVIIDNDVKTTFTIVLIIILAIVITALTKKEK